MTIREWTPHDTGLPLAKIVERIDVEGLHLVRRRTIVPIDDTYAARLRQASNALGSEQ